jgi:uncharacterized alpha-E superfamily protein
MELAMLSRTADHLFWMARYMERAENTARMLDINYQTSLLPQSADKAERGWRGMLGISELTGTYERRHGRIDARRVMTFMVRDETHPSSIVSCLRAARENARAVRGTITSEMWETLNSTYLESRSFNATMPEAGRGEFLEWVKYRAHLQRGVASGTMVRDEALSFSRIGTFLERADSTTRLLEARWRDPGGRGERLATEASEWAVLLRAMSAFETYRRVTREAVTPKRVTELLLMRDDLPQSVHRCLSELYSNLTAVANDQSAETLRRAGELHAQFLFGRFDDLCSAGVTTFLDGLQARLRDIGARIADDFLVPLGT